MSMIDSFQLRRPVRVGILTALTVICGMSQQLLSNGDFSLGLAGWTPNTGGPCGTRTVSLLDFDAPYAKVVELASVNGYGCGGGSEVYQNVNVALSEYSVLILSADVKAVSADVGNGCGWNGLEYPIELMVHFVDPTGANRILIFPFYYGGGSCGHPDGSWSPTVIWGPQTQVPQGEWTRFVSPNLKSLIPLGSTITSVTASAGGWDYVGRADNLRLDVVPIFSGMPADGCTLWPPDHKMVQVAVISAINPIPGLLPGSFEVTATSSEASDPIDPDIDISPNGLGAWVVRLRAERLGSEKGRIYTITAKASDLAGHTSTATAICAVPHDQAK